MRKRFNLQKACILACLILSGPALAHHSVAAYDVEHVVPMEGTVKSISWTNPHITYQVEVLAKDNKAAEIWVFETSSPGVLTRSGWTKKSLQPGDRAIFAVAPLRSGNFGGYVTKATLPDGQVLTYSFLPSEQ